MKKILLIVLGLAGIMLLGVSVYAQENPAQGIEIGQAVLYPTINLEERYDSNIFLTADDEKDDWINVTTPQVKLECPIGEKGRHKAEVLYSAAIFSYADYDDENAVNQDATGKLTLELPKGSLAVKDLYRDTKDRSSNEFAEQVRRIENTTDVVLNWGFNKLSTDLGYTHFIKNYVDSSYTALEYTEDIWTAIGYYQLFPKTKGLLEYNYGTVDYQTDSPDRDGDYNQVRVGLKGDLTGKTVGTVKAGYQDRNYDDDSNDDFEGFSSEIGLVTTFSERTILDLRFTSTPIESTYGNNNYYAANRFASQLTQKLWDNISLIGTFGYERSTYPEIVAGTTEKRKDNIWTTGLGLQYDIQDWVKAKLSYEYKEDASNIDTKDYNRNLTALSVTLAL